MNNQVDILEQAKSKHESGKFEEAIMLFQEAFLTQEPSADSLSTLFEAEEMAYNKYLAKISKLYPDSSVIRFHLAKSNSHVGLSGQAILICTQILAKINLDKKFEIRLRLFRFGTHLDHYEPNIQLIMEDFAFLWKLSSDDTISIDMRKTVIAILLKAMQHPRKIQILEEIAKHELMDNSVRILLEKKLELLREAANLINEIG